MLNQSVIEGRVVRPIQPQYLQSGVAVARFTIASDENRRSTDQNGKTYTPADFISCEMWGRGGYQGQPADNRQVENLANFAPQGRLISVVGKIDPQHYQDRQTGQMVYKQPVRVFTFNLLGSNPSMQSNNGQQGQQGRGAQMRDPLATGTSPQGQGQRQPMGNQGGQPSNPFANQGNRGNRMTPNNGNQMGGYPAGNNGNTMNNFPNGNQPRGNGGRTPMNNGFPSNGNQGGVNAPQNRPMPRGNGGTANNFPNNGSQNGGQANGNPMAPKGPQGQAPRGNGKPTTPAGPKKPLTGQNAANKFQGGGKKKIDISDDDLPF